MSREPERSVRLSVVDRLMDLEPGLGDAPTTWNASVDALKQAVLRDLEWLLNTRRIAFPAPAHYAEVGRSVYHFGLPDVTSRSADSDEVRQELARDIEECIRLFEPRLMAVRVLSRTASDPGARRARFSIEALLRMEPNPERVVFDTVLDAPTGKFFVSGESDA